METLKKHIITALVENHSGVLARIVGLISGRGFNIETLNVAPTKDPTVSRLTMKVPGDDRVLEQVAKQLNKLIDVIKVTDITQQHYLNRELILIEIQAPPQKRTQVIDLTKLIPEATVISVQEKSLTIQIIGEQDKINEFLTLLKPFKILDISRSGVIAVARGE